MEEDLGFHFHTPDENVLAEFEDHDIQCWRCKSSLVCIEKADPIGGIEVVKIVCYRGCEFFLPLCDERVTEAIGCDSAYKGSGHYDGF